MCPSLRPARRHNTHKTGMCRVNTRPHRLQKRIVFRLNSKCWFRDGRLQSVCQFFYPMIVVPDYTSITFREVPSAPPFVLIYITSVKKASRKGQNAANLSEKTAEWAKISLNSALQTLLAHAARGEQTTAVFFSPSATSFAGGRPVLREKRPPTFLAREGLRQAFGEKPQLDLLRASRGKPVLPLLLIATSPADPAGPRPPPDAAAGRTSASTLRGNCRCAL